jgi:hypothetical protein
MRGDPSHNPSKFGQTSTCPHRVQRGRQTRLSVGVHHLATRKYPFAGRQMGLVVRGTAVLRVAGASGNCPQSGSRLFEPSPSGPAREPSWRRSWPSWSFQPGIGPW